MIFWSVYAATGKGTISSVMLAVGIVSALITRFEIQPVRS